MDDDGITREQSTASARWSKIRAYVAKYKREEEEGIGSTVHGVCLPAIEVGGVPKLPLPHDDPHALLLRVAEANPSVSPPVRQLVLSELSQRLLCACFWYIVVMEFQQEGVRDEYREVLFGAMATSYALLFQGVARKDALLRTYADLLAQALYTAFHVSFAFDRALFDEGFMLSLQANLHFWITGLVLSHPNVSSWEMASWHRRYKARAKNRVPSKRQQLSNRWAVFEGVERKEKEVSVPVAVVNQSLSLNTTAISIEHISKSLEGVRADLHFLGKESTLHYGRTGQPPPPRHSADSEDPESHPKTGVDSEEGDPDDVVWKSWMGREPQAMYALGGQSPLITHFLNMVEDSPQCPVNAFRAREHVGVPGDRLTGVVSDYHSVLASAKSRPTTRIVIPRDPEPSVADEPIAAKWLTLTDQCVHRSSNLHSPLPLSPEGSPLSPTRAKRILDEVVQGGNSLQEQEEIQHLLDTASLGGTRSEGGRAGDAVPSSTRRPRPSTATTRDHGRSSQSLPPRPGSAPSCGRTTVQRPLSALSRLTSVSARSQGSALRSGGALHPINVFTSGAEVCDPRRCWTPVKQQYPYMDPDELVPVNARLNTTADPRERLNIISPTPMTDAPPVKKERAKVSAGGIASRKSQMAINWVSARFDRSMKHVVARGRAIAQQGHSKAVADRHESQQVDALLTSLDQQRQRSLIMLCTERARLLREGNRGKAAKRREAIEGLHQVIEQAKPNVSSRTALENIVALQKVTAYIDDNLTSLPNELRTAVLEYSVKKKGELNWQIRRCRARNRRSKEALAVLDRLEREIHKDDAARAPRITRKREGVPTHDHKIAMLLGTPPQDNPRDKGGSASRSVADLIKEVGELVEERTPELTPPEVFEVDILEALGALPQDATTTKLSKRLAGSRRDGITEEGVVAVVHRLLWMRHQQQLEDSMVEQGEDDEPSSGHHLSYLFELEPDGLRSAIAEIIDGCTAEPSLADQIVSELCSRVLALKGVTTPTQGTGVSALPTEDAGAGEGEEEGQVAKEEKEDGGSCEKARESGGREAQEDNGEDGPADGEGSMHEAACGSEVKEEFIPQASPPLSQSAASLLGTDLFLASSSGSVPQRQTAKRRAWSVGQSFSPGSFATSSHDAPSTPVGPSAHTRKRSTPSARHASDKTDSAAQASESEASPLQLVPPPRLDPDDPQSILAALATPPPRAAPRGRAAAQVQAVPQRAGGRWRDRREEKVLEKRSVTSKFLGSALLREWKKRRDGGGRPVTSAEDDEKAMEERSEVFDTLASSLGRRANQGPHATSRTRIDFAGLSAIDKYVVWTASHHPIGSSSVELMQRVQQNRNARRAEARRS